MVSFEPNFGEVGKPAILCNFSRREMVVEVEDWFVLCILVIKRDRFVASQQEVFVNEAHEGVVYKRGCSVDLDSELLNFAGEGEGILVEPNGSTFVSSYLKAVDRHLRNQSGKLPLADYLFAIEKFDFPIFV